MFERLTGATSFKQLAYRAGFPLLVFVVAGLTLNNVDRIDPAYMDLFALSPYFLLLLVVALAYRFNQARIFGVALTLIATYWGARTFLQQPLSEPVAHYVYTATGFLLPFNLLVAMAFSERGMVHWTTLTLIALIPLELGVLWLGWQGIFDLPSLFMQFEPHPFEGYVLSRTVTVWFEIVLAASLALAVWRQPKGTMAILWALVAQFCLLAWFYVPDISTVMTATSSIMLLMVPLNHAYNMAYLDELTGLKGRRALNEKMRSLGRNYVIAMMDIDHFKKFNDTYGHDAGDEVLRIVAKHIGRVGAGGIPYRYGGEEFTVVFSGTDVEACVAALEEVRRDIAVYDMALRDHGSRPQSAERGASKRGKKASVKRVRVTISIGVAEHTDKIESAQDVLKAADRALYRAKKKGRNCLVQA